jgi:hypothetical protein
MGAVLLAGASYWLVWARRTRPDEPGGPAPGDQAPASETADAPVR